MARRCFCFLHTALIIGLRQRRDAEKTAIVIGLRKRRDAEKTAEERFNMLARGWLAYPVTPIHSHLPPKSGCRNVILAKLPYEAHLLKWAYPNSTNLPHLPD